MKSFFEKNMAATYSPVPILAGCSTIGPPTGGLTAPFSMGSGSYNNFGKGRKTKKPFNYLKGFFEKNMAATYSPAFLCSTMGHEGLNFSVRYGKR